MKNKLKVLVTGAGGFIGHHLVNFLKEKGCRVRGVDIKYPEFDETGADEFHLLDLRLPENCLAATEGGIDEVYALAADMGGMGFISAHHAEIGVFRPNPRKPSIRILAKLGINKIFKNHQEG